MILSVQQPVCACQCILHMWTHHSHVLCLASEYVCTQPWHGTHFCISWWEDVITTHNITPFTLFYTECFRYNPEISAWTIISPTSFTKTNYPWVSLTGRHNYLSTHMFDAKFVGGGARVKLSHFRKCAWTSPCKQPPIHSSWTAFVYSIITPLAWAINYQLRGSAIYSNDPLFVLPCTKTSYGLTDQKT